MDKLLSFTFNSKNTIYKVDFDSKENIQKIKDSKKDTYNGTFKTKLVGYNLANKKDRVVVPIQFTVISGVIINFGVGRFD